jgi:hypothetical protein
MKMETFCAVGCAISSFKLDGWRWFQTTVDEIFRRTLDFD